MAPFGNQTIPPVRTAFPLLIRVRPDSHLMAVPLMVALEPMTVRPEPLMVPPDQLKLLTVRSPAPPRVPRFDRPSVPLTVEAAAMNRKAPVMFRVPSLVR